MVSHADSCVMGQRKKGLNVAVFFSGASALAWSSIPKKIW